MKLYCPTIATMKVSSLDLETDATSCQPAVLDTHTRVRCTLIKSMIGSPSGMSQLIRYFEIQSQRLDRQSLVSSHAATSCLNSQFESSIKFDGVPILAPAMTQSRREALKQHKKDAILLEKKLKMRHRRQHRTDKHPSQETPSSAVRQLNFDAGVPEQNCNSNTSTLKYRLGATNHLSTFANADTVDNGEDFGLRTMDSVNSDFMSLEDGNLPTVFSGHTLKSLKEQKISYNLDHLCKELNVQDLGSTSGSDLSDALASTQNLLSDNTGARGERWAQKVATQRLGDGLAQGLSFCHESQDTVVEVSPESGSDHTNHGGDCSTSSGFVERCQSSNLEHTQTSVGSSPGCGSANTSDSQKSKVHFASFILEYNTSASQSLESTTVIKKKMSPSEMQEDDGAVENNDGHNNSRGYPVSLAKTLENKAKTSLSRNISNEGSPEELLNQVVLQQDSDASPTCKPATAVPFQTYASSNEAWNSDKENDGSQVIKHEYSSRHAIDSACYQRGSASHEEPLPDHYHNSHKSRVKRVSGDGYEREGSSNKQNVSSIVVSDPHTTNEKPYATGGMGCALSQTSLPPSSSVSVGASQLTTSSCNSENLLSVSQVSLGIHSSGVGSANRQSGSDSQTSSVRSTTLTGTSGSSSSTIKEDHTPKSITNLGLNIVDSGNGYVDLQDVKNNDKKMNNGSGMGKDKCGTVTNNDFDIKDNNRMPHSPKRLYADSKTDEDRKEMEGKTTPKQTHVRRGSYTLSHPSPALLQARGQIEKEEEKEKGEDDDKEKSSLSSSDENIPVKDEDSTLKKKLDFNELIQDLEESSNRDKDGFTTTNVPSDPEKDGKAEHINKYLRHVQFQNSMNLQSLDLEQSLDIVETDHHVSDDELNNLNDHRNDERGEMPGDSYMSVLQSIADSQLSMGKLSDIEVQTLHQHQMELARQVLVDQQRKDMEELFVQQRKEIMKFEVEIRLAQQQSLEQNKFILQNAPENLKVRAKYHDNEFSPENTASFNSGSNHYIAQQNTLSSINSVDNMRPQSLDRHSFNEHHSGYPSLNLQPKSYPSMAPKQSKPQPITGSSRRMVNSHYLSNQSPKTISDQEYGKRVVNSEGFYHQQHASHDLKDIGYTIPEFGSPSISSPRIHRGIGINYGEMHSRRNAPVTVPSQAYQPEMKAKFEHLSAVAKGFLTRCLMQSDKVQDLIKTIKDTREFFTNFQTETPIKRGNITSQDKALMERIQAQLQGALFDIHEIFFDLSSEERMALIEQTRVKEYVKKVKSSRDSTDVSRMSGPRMSQATMKALERKRKAREAEAIAILSTSTNSSVSRKTGSSSNNNSPRCQNHTDGSGPLKRHFGYLISRALKPLQGQQSHQNYHQAQSSTSNNKDKKVKPLIAPEKQLTRPKRMNIQSSNSSKQSHSQAVVDTDRDSGLSKPTASTTAKVITKSKVVPSSYKPASRPTKSWR